MSLAEKILNEKMLGCNIDAMKKHWHFKKSVLEAMEEYKNIALINDN